MPPFGRLAALIVSGRDEAAVDATARALARAAPAVAGVRVLGPAPAPLAMLRGRHRRRLLAHSRRSFALSATCGDWLAATALPGLGPGAGRHRPAELPLVRPWVAVISERRGTPRLS